MHTSFASSTGYQPNGSVTNYMLHNFTITYKIKSNNKILLDLRSKSVDEANRQQMKSKAENETVKVQVSLERRSRLVTSNYPCDVCGPLGGTNEFEPHTQNKIPVPSLRGLS